MKLTATQVLFRQPVRHVFEASPHQLVFPEEGLPEVAFIGRSNVGKSSLINALVGQKALARTSNTPGRTQGVQFFNLADKLLLVDLPGYGYANLSKELIEKINLLVGAYLQRGVLRRVFVLVDARHGLKQSDKDMLTLLAELGVPSHLVLTKLDKLRGAQVSAAVSAITTQAQQCVGTMANPVPVSSRTMLNVDMLQAEVANAAGVVAWNLSQN